MSWMVHEMHFISVHENLWLITKFFVPFTVVNMQKHFVSEHNNSVSSTSSMGMQQTTSHPYTGEKSN